MRPLGRSPLRTRTAGLVVLAGLVAGAVLPSAQAVPLPDGPSTTVPVPSPVDGFAAYAGQTTCDPTTKPGARAVLKLAMDHYGIGRDTGINRHCATGGQSEHKEGRAFDWGLRVDRPAEKAAGDAFTHWLTAPGPDGKPGYNARRLGVMYVIWNRKIWTAATAQSTGWRTYNGESAHTDHVHVSLSWNGAYMRTSWWTGSLVAQAPIGSVDAISTTESSLTVHGWALDPDTSDPTDVHVYVDGVGVAHTAKLSRPDVAAFYGRGDKHGFSLTLPQKPGPHTVCTYAIDSDPTGHTPLGCRTVTVQNAAPIGSVDSVQSTATSATVTGWTLDPDTSSSTSVQVAVDGATVATVPATASRPDVAAAFGRGDRHGFSVTTPLTPGRHELCVYGTDSAGGPRVTLLCRSVGVEVSTAAPTGVLDTVTASSMGVTASGWTLDPDTDDPTEVHLYVDGVGAAVIADQPRPDVAAAFGRGERRGFTYTKRLAAGPHSLCAHAINTGPGGHTLLGCRNFTVTNAAPIGSLDAVTVSSGAVSVSGWALDPDSREPIDVHVAIGGQSIAVRADASRMDVAAAYGRGDRHGFGYPAKAQPGRQDVCVYAIDTTGTDHRLLGCRTVDVPA